jgi:alpha-ketoglutarate-dependent taurine dioxygenase
MMLPTCTHDVRSVRLAWPDGVVGAFHALWLVDNRPSHRDAHSGQRLVDILDLPPTVSIRTARIEGDRLCVDFADGIESLSLPVGFLREQAQPLETVRLDYRRDLWADGAVRDAHRDFAWADYARFVADPHERGAWLERLATEGLAFLRAVPAEAGRVVEAAGLMGEVVRTNYGLLFDVRAVARAENLAYTDLGLGLHADNPYREPVPGFQALHVLVAAPEGGESLFADGFAIAEYLQVTDPEAYARLATTPVSFHYRSADTDLHATAPLIDVAPDGRLRAVRYNNRSIAPLRVPIDEVESFYRAYRAYATLLRDPSFQVRLLMQAGDLVVFDNRRVMHGRTAFVSARHPRHLQGCYIARDSVYSNAVRLTAREEIS